MGGASDDGSGASIVEYMGGEYTFVIKNANESYIQYCVLDGVKKEGLIEDMARLVNYYGISVSMPYKPKYKNEKLIEVSPSLFGTQIKGINNAHIGVINLSLDKEAGKLEISNPSCSIFSIEGARYCIEYGVRMREDGKLYRE
jgi:hypothetical protein